MSHHRPGAEDNRAGQHEVETIHYPVARGIANKGWHDGPKHEVEAGEWREQHSQEDGTAEDDTDFKLWRTTQLP